MRPDPAPSLRDPSPTAAGPPAARPGAWMPFSLIALSLVAETMGATLSSPLYPLYERAWAISHATITTVHVAYMVGVLGAFLSLGGLCDSFGPVGVVRAALLAALAGLAVSACAGGPVVLGLGRALIGAASGVISTAATIGLLRHEPGGPRHASLTASVTTMLGFGSGPLLGGLVGQFAPAPLVTPYAVVAAAIVLILAGLFAIAETPGLDGGRRFSLRPALHVPQADARTGFVLKALASFLAYALFTLLASLAPTFLGDLLPWHGPVVSGIAVAAVLFCSAAVQLSARRLPPRLSLPLALTMLGVGVLFLAAMRLRNGAPFAASDLLIGMGHGLSFMSGLALVKATASPERHTGTLSLYFSICCLGAIVPVLLVGQLADAIGLSAAVTAFCLVFACLCASTLALSRGRL